jgi:hypothetical protein
MQSSSSGTLSTLGLLACAAAVGMLAAKKLPQGPPRDLPLRVWDWVAGQVPPPMAQGEARDYGPAPPFDSRGKFDVEILPDGSTGPNVEMPGRSPPAARAPEHAPPGDFRIAPGGAEPPMRGIDYGPPSAPPLSPPPRDDAPKAAPFWPGDLKDLIPGLESEAGGSGTSPPGDHGRPTPTSSKSQHPHAPGTVELPHEPGIEELMRRLERLGAVVVRLERRRDVPAGYVFRCELPLPRNPRYHRFFEAVDAEPARAIQRVMRDVEVWKATAR